MEMIELVLNRFDLKDYFSVLVSGNDLPKSKPDPLIFLTVAQRLAVSPEIRPAARSACETPHNEPRLNAKSYSFMVVSGWFCVL